MIKTEIPEIFKNCLSGVASSSLLVRLPKHRQILILGLLAFFYLRKLCLLRFTKIMCFKILKLSLYVIRV